MGKPKSIVKRAKDGEYYWLATGGNGEPQAHGETHPFQAGARRAWKTFLTVTCVALLRDLGYTVIAPTICAHCKKVFGDDEVSVYEDENVCGECGELELLDEARGYGQFGPKGKKR